MNEKEIKLLEKLLKKQADEKRKDRLFFKEILKRKDEVLKFLNENEESFSSSEQASEQEESSSSSEQEESKEESSKTSSSPFNNYVNSFKLQ